ncbi:diacylglycerol/lipid kinase family protein [Companilactobacillus mishanensis]|uniref:Diacylglycerol kinase family lipid kinase n=1 Tax=Companilactobacillus mishanensis TaxID=2486008 RepID=A0A5P0ZGX9_9LACO|nr:diacylglycerol kinase family protein [Companilactobacillus mishanensis]MQS52279.1 diacylglycerol kinase family lipid kinase [Companilactobacillus mishanensis]
MSKIEKIEIIYNKRAGNGQSKSTWNKIQNFLKNAEINFEVHETKCDGDGIPIAKQLAENITPFTRILVIGGDGTLNQALNGVMISDNPDTPLAYIPSGSGNDFSRGLKIKKQSPLELLQKMLIMDDPVTIDVAQADDLNTNQTKYFVNNIGMGFDASTVYYTNHSKRKDILNTLKMGTLAYVSSLIKVIHLQGGFPIDVEYGNKTKHFDSAYIVVATNHPYFGGGIAIDPLAQPFDEKLDLVVVNKITGMTFVKLFTKLLTNGSHLKDKEVWHIQEPEFTISDHSVEQGQMDGEELGQHEFHIHFKSIQHQFWLPIE